MLCSIMHSTKMKENGDHDGDSSVQFSFSPKLRNYCDSRSSKRQDQYFKATIKSYKFG